MGTREIAARKPHHAEQVLLVGCDRSVDQLRAAAWRERGIGLDFVEDLDLALHRLQEHAYRLVLVDVRRRLPGEIAEFVAQADASAVPPHVGFLVGPPDYVSDSWPGELLLDHSGESQWDATVRSLMTSR